MLQFTGERFIPTKELFNGEIGIEHLHRYKSIIPFIKNKTVLDIACGEGYGSALIGNYAQKVYGIDIDESCIQWATAHYSKINNKLDFKKGTVDKIPLPDKSVEVVVSFETIEHITAETQLLFLSEAKRVLKPDGLLIISTPNKKNYTERYNHHNEFHLHELIKEDFESLLKKHFTHVTLYDQGFEITSLILNKGSYSSEKPLASLKIDENAYNFEGKYLIGVCSDNYEDAHIPISSIIPESEKSYFSLIDRIIALQQEVLSLGAWGKNSNEEVEAMRKDTEDLSALVKQSNDELEATRAQIATVEALKKASEDRLQEIFSSNGWQLLNKYYRFKAKYLAQDSRIYKVLRYFVRLVKTKRLQPVTERPAEILKREKTFVIPDVPGNIKFPLTFPVFDQPLVSIIIPVYNNWVFTRNCLISIYQHTNDIRYEIIVADDMSTDEVVNLKNYFENINHLRNQENLGYIRNVNNASRHVRGKFILTLNNDTTVTPNWLNTLLEVMEKDELTGLVGSKLLYPDGTLQEAGGILWKDGTGWNYGNCKDPDAPEYNYLKETDYVSGASLLVRKELWDRLKGLDETFVPAYFDDSDLAFNIRQLGYKTIYQPLSVVIHYEGVSHGTNTGSGIKIYQEINAQKFVNKWEPVLKKEHLENGKDVFVARDRSQNKKTVLVIDHYVPQFDKDAGSRTTFNILQILTKLNYNVKFIGDNYYNHQPYTTILQQMGVEVLYGEWYRDNWRAWMKDNRKYIDYIYLNRPHITIKYIDDIKALTKAKVFYYGHDLHFLREQKQYELKRDPKLLQSIEYWKKLETEIFEKSDTVLTCSDEEKEVIEKVISNKDIQVIPAYYYSEFNQPVSNFSERNNLLFVGGFNHTPNVDAVLWFAKEVFPLINKKVPGIKFIVVGSNPPKEVTDLMTTDSIEILGYVSTEELNNLYKRTKLVVIPLRYGAGVKGKTVEAMHQGVPFVTTQFGIEGLVEINAIVTSRNTAEEFADGVTKLYSDNNALIDFSKKTIDYVSNNFSETNIKTVIDKLFL